MLLLGADVALGARSIRASARADRARELRSVIEQAPKLTCSPLPPRVKFAGVSVLRPLLAGKSGMGTMGPLILRQYGQRCARLAPHLRRNLLRRYCAVGRLRPRVAEFRLLPPVGDRAGAPGWGISLLYADPQYSAATSLHLPAWFCDVAFWSDAESEIFFRTGIGCSNGVRVGRMGRCVATVLYPAH